MQRIGYFFAVLRSLDMSLLIVSRRQRYNKVWKQQNNLKRNIKKRYDKGENLTPLLLLKRGIGEVCFVWCVLWFRREFFH